MRLEKEKTCRRCSKLKPLDELVRHREMPLGRDNLCKPCNVAIATEWRKVNRKRYNETRALSRQANSHRFAVQREESLASRYGITSADYDALLIQQNSCCGICGRHADAVPRRKQDVRGLHVDHDHDTGLVRGLLCLNCNGGLGQLQDSPSILRAALRYLDAST